MLTEDHKLQRVEISQRLLQRCQQDNGDEDTTHIVGPGGDFQANNNLFDNLITGRCKETWLGELQLRLVTPQPIWLGIAHLAHIDEQPLALETLKRYHRQSEKSQTYSKEEPRRNHLPTETGMKTSAEILPHRSHSKPVRLIKLPTNSSSLLTQKTIDSYPQTAIHAYTNDFAFLGTRFA
ncbi:hypothetical protein PoB_005087700 [Plakobranchus ocellatus]|uniref:Uncharacterized protein n=1 Tax=Plakobranchus ocellatus TaxID=259542 RepID=A0AAV4BYH6_9GAST|nr:hypothetical protein PoB_005087700 [Plakobranchus ocellatus]